MDLKGTTICGVWRDGKCAIAGDGQVIMGEHTIFKGGAVKVRRICDGAALMEAGRIVEQGDLLDLLTDPASRLADILLPVGDPTVAGVLGEPVVLSFAQGNTQEAIISGLTRQFGLDVSIVGGTVEAIAGRKVGRLRVALSHPEGRYDRDAVASYLAEHEVSVQL